MSKKIIKFTDELAEYDLSPSQMKLLYELLDSKGNVKGACNKSGVSRQSYYNWSREDVFQVALQKTKTEIDRRRVLLEDFRTKEVEDKLYENAKEGKENSIIFWLKNRDPHRWKNDYIQGQEYTQYIQNNINFLQTEVSDMNNKELIEAAKILTEELSRGKKDEVTDIEVKENGSGEAGSEGESS